MMQDWIFSVRFWPDAESSIPRRAAVVGPGRSSTVEAALHLAGVPESLRAEIRANETVCKFVESALDPAASGYYAPNPVSSSHSWLVCIGSVHEVLDRTASKETASG
jgi:hypothetical protein